MPHTPESAPGRAIGWGRAWRSRPRDVRCARFTGAMNATAERTWRVEAAVAFPTEIALGPGGGLPAKLEPRSRMPTGTVVMNGVRIGLRPATGEETTAREQNPGIAWGIVMVEVTAPDPSTAHRRAIEAVEPLVESLSFQLQVSLRVFGIRATDVTTPVTVGETREFGQFSGYPLKRFRPATVQMSGVLTQTVPALVGLPVLDRRQRAALDWYLKALAAQFEVDQFIFLWIAFEILSDRSDFRVEGPLITRCQHEIAECPICGKPTTRIVQGETRRRFLIDIGEIEADVAAELWKARQILHGAEEFDSAVMDRLAALAQVLRAVVNAVLKEALGLAADAVPIVEHGHLGISPDMGVGGTHVIRERDLAWPSPAVSWPE
jgi:hypothetical protein